MKADLRKAVMNNLVTSLFLHGHIKTTIAKGKATVPVAEKLINSIKGDETFIAIRKLSKVIKSEVASKRIMEEWLPKFKDQPSGFVKLHHLGPRKSDASEMVQISVD